ncbi:XRE family transcriptional regulator [bacterium D16-51]|nr:XRE family transcriptional regulator [bacterium D16-59]RKI61020.1 XRE family transcriptional regulator [bacterium D16-51]
MQRIDDVGISRRLCSLRNGSGQKEVDISTVLEISQAHYCRLEQAKSKITVDVLQRACAYYGVTAEYILFGMARKPGSIFRRLEGFSEEDSRRFLKILSCLLFTEDNAAGQKDSAVYKIFMGGLMELLPAGASSAIPAVLEYEKNIRGVSENIMIKELGISRFVWTSIMKGAPIKNIEIPLKIQEQYGYGLDFLINNRVQDDLFLETLLSKETLARRQEILGIFDRIIKL